MTNPYEDISDEIATRTIRVESVKNQCQTIIIA